jgi:branched-chain amino acid transport system ATP-binding protein
MSLLELEDLDLHYGDFQAVFDVSLALEEGRVLAVIGANGAGKSTLLRSVAGTLAPTRGDIRLRGHSLVGVPPHRRVSDGVSLTPEGRRIFRSLSVEENLLVGGHTRRPGPWSLQKIYDTFPLVHDRKARLGAHLSGGEQQAVAIGRALMSNPDVLLLDEVSLGLAPVAVAEIYAAVPRIVEEGTSVLLVEQDVHQSMSVADSVVCLLEGRVVLRGLPGELTHEQIATAYFGIED